MDLNTHTHTSGDDVIQPFQIDVSNLRGRLVRLGGVVDDILSQHAYPEPVARKLGETLALATVLAGMLKYDGVFTLQTKGDGPISLIVADVTSAGDVRGYAQFDPERLEGARGDSVGDLLGSGYLAFTVDQGEYTDRYQGIVELTGETMTDCVQHYFRQSEQLDTAIHLAVGKPNGGWRAGVLMIQRLPEQRPEDGKPLANDVEDDWRRAMVLMSSATTGELLDPELTPEQLLYRLFHEEGVRVYDTTELRHNCRCSRERVATILKSLPREEIVHLKDEGEVKVTCEFCNATYGFDDRQLAELYDGAPPSTH